MLRFLIRKFTSSNKDNTIFKCVECKHFIKHIENGKEYDGLGKCRINGYTLKSGPVYFYASSCRNNDIYCGEKGKFFKK